MSPPLCADFRSFEVAASDAVGLSHRHRRSDWINFAIVATSFSLFYIQVDKAHGFSTSLSHPQINPFMGRTENQVALGNVYFGSFLRASNGNEQSDEQSEEVKVDELGSNLQRSGGPVDNEDGSPSVQAAISAKEMLFRESNQDPQVLKKKKKKTGVGYQPMDNRDHLPFVVQVMTPDPYTKRQLIQEKARQRTKEENAKKRKKKVSPPLTTDISSSLQLQQQDGSTQLLGEFALDKSTTTGDWILIGDVEYQVTSAKCQYKYAGGKRFVMVRKILQVKEIRRLEQEAQLFRQLQATPDDNTIVGGLWVEDPSTPPLL